MNFRIFAFTVALGLMLNPLKQVQATESETLYSDAEIAQIADAKEIIQECFKEIEEIRKNVEPTLNILRSCPTLNQDQVKSAWELINTKKKDLNSLDTIIEKLPPFLSMEFLACTLTAGAEALNTLLEEAIPLASSTTTPEQKAQAVEIIFNQEINSFNLFLNKLNSNNIDKNNSYNKLFIRAITIVHPLVHNIINRINNFPTTGQENELSSLRTMGSDDIARMITDKINSDPELLGHLTTELDNALTTFTNKVYNSKEELLAAADEFFKTRVTIAENWLEIAQFWVPETPSDYSDITTKGGDADFYWTHESADAGNTSADSSTDGSAPEINKMFQLLQESHVELSMEMSIEKITRTLQELETKYLNYLKPELSSLAECSSLTENSALLAQIKLSPYLDEISTIFAALLEIKTDQIVYLNMIDCILAACSQSLDQTSERLQSLSSPMSPKLFAELLEIANQALVHGIHLFLERYHSNNLNNDINVQDLFTRTIDQMNKIFDFSFQIMQSHTTELNPKNMLKNAKNHVQILREVVKRITLDSDIQEGLFNEIDKEQDAFFRKSFSSVEELRAGLHTLFDETVSIAENWLGVVLSLEQ